MPCTDQMPEMAPYVRTLPSNINTRSMTHSINKCRDARLRNLTLDRPDLTLEKNSDPDTNPSKIKIMIRERKRMDPI